MIEIISDFGFCSGVKHAIDLMKNSKGKYKNLYLTHPLIHNRLENELLMQECDSKVYNSSIKLEKDDGVLLSAHGHKIEEEHFFKSKCNVIDATCPLIKARYKSIEKYDDKTTFIYIGKKGHQETEGFLSNFPYFIFIDDKDDIIKRLENIEYKTRVILIPQTTLSLSKYELALNYLKNKIDNFKYYSICPSYKERLDVCHKKALECDANSSIFIVIGDKMSSNANEIYQTIKTAKANIEAYLILNTEELNLNALKNKDIYLTSATSVDANHLLKIKKELEDLKL